MRYAGSQFEIREMSEEGMIEGMLAGFGDVDRQDSVLAPGCFQKSIASRQGRPLPMLLHHDLHRPIGAWREIDERGGGLWVKGKIEVETRDGSEAYALAKSGALSGLSVGFITRQKTVDQRSGVETIKEGDLLEGSLVTVPANARANVAEIKAINSPKDIADLLRMGGVSSRKAKAAAGQAWRAISEPESDEAVDPELVALVKAATARIANGDWKWNRHFWI